MGFFGSVVGGIENLGKKAANAVDKLEDKARDKVKQLSDGAAALKDQAVQKVQDLKGDLSRGLHQLENQARAFADRVSQEISRAVSWVGHTVGQGLTLLINGALVRVGDLIGVHIRPLTSGEHAILERVFRGTVPLERLLITSLSGVGNRPFTIPGSLIVSAAAAVPFLAPIAGIAALVTYLRDSYLLNLGPAGFADGLNVTADDSTKLGTTLVHEVAHAWQGFTGAFSWWYIFSSLYNQATKTDAYAYNAGRQWRDYNAEQQAHIVEDWYAKGKEKGDNALYPYMKFNVWRAAPQAYADLNARDAHLRGA